MGIDAYLGHVGSPTGPRQLFLGVEGDRTRAPARSIRGARSVVAVVPYRQAKQVGSATAGRIDVARRTAARRVAVCLDRREASARRSQRPLHQLGGSLAGNDAALESSTSSRSRNATSAASVASGPGSALPSALSSRARGLCGRADPLSIMSTPSLIAALLAMGPHPPTSPDTQAEGAARDEYRFSSPARVARGSGLWTAASARVQDVHASRTTSATTTALLCCWSRAA
jgi:hypothetical protein